MLKNKIKKILKISLLFLFFFVVLFFSENLKRNKVLASKNDSLTSSIKEEDIDIENFLDQNKEDSKIKTEVEELIKQIKETKKQINNFFSIEKIEFIKDHISKIIKEGINEIFSKSDSGSWETKEDPFKTMSTKIKDLRLKINNNLEKTDNIEKLNHETTSFKDLNYILSKFYEVFKDNFVLITDDINAMEQDNNLITDLTQKIDSKIFSELKLSLVSTQQKILGSNPLEKDESEKIQSNIKDITSKYSIIKEKIQPNSSISTSNNLFTVSNSVKMVSIITMIIVLCWIFIFNKKNKINFKNNQKHKK